MIKLTLPHPISVNVAYAGMRVRYKSKAYKNWENLAYIDIKNLEKMKVTEGKKLLVTYTLYTECYYKNWNHKRIDVANYEKVVSDFLWHIIENFEDSYIYDMHMIKINSSKNQMDIEIEEIEEEEEDKYNDSTANNK